MKISIHRILLTAVLGIACIASTVMLHAEVDKLMTKFVVEEQYKESIDVDSNDVGPVTVIIEENNGTVNVYCN